MRKALHPVLPDAPPGITVADAKAALLTSLPQDLFPGGEKAGWWLKAVQLDLEAKGVIAREATKPVRLCRCAKQGSFVPGQTCKRGARRRPDVTPQCGRVSPARVPHSCCHRC